MEKNIKAISEKTEIPWLVLDKLHPDEIVKLETETKNIYQLCIQLKTM